VTPFDLEAARCGEPIQIGSSRDGWRDVSFVGQTPSGDIVLCELTAPGREMLITFTGDPTGRLRMKPQKRTVYVNFYPKQSGACAACEAYDDEASARFKAGAHATAIAIPVEIEE
jgi:hypothetical protein